VQISLQRFDSNRREQTGQYREASSLVLTVVRSTSAATATRSTFAERFSSAAFLGSCEADAAAADTAATLSDALEAASCFQARSTARWL